jgi:hypothetical protein
VKVQQELMEENQVGVAVVINLILNEKNNNYSKFSS